MTAPVDHYHMPCPSNHIVMVPAGLLNEELIHEALSHYVKNRTVIMITHRPSTLALADSILEVEHGQVTKRPAANYRAA